ncbi:MAG: hypothetical protein D6805_08770 [Planctomycetota bacterium]|nr:MAG: hypothetical protein D6805_08770 [Planctomycetota bacterium]
MRTTLQRKLILPLFLLLSGCGAIGTGVGIWLGSQRNLRNNSKPSISISSPSFSQNVNDMISIVYEIRDTESDAANVKVEWSTDEQTWYTCTEQVNRLIDLQSDGTQNLTTSPGGIQHTFVWNSLMDIFAANLPNVSVRITPTDTTTKKTGFSATVKINVVNEYITTLLGRTPTGSNKRLHIPRYIASDGKNLLYISNKKGNSIVKLDLNSPDFQAFPPFLNQGILSLAGTGLTPFNGDNLAANLSNLNNPAQVALTTDRSTGDAVVIFADSFNHRLRQVNLRTNFISTLAGTSTPGYDNNFASDAFNDPLQTSLDTPFGIAIPPKGAAFSGIFFSEKGNRTIRFINWSTSPAVFYSTPQITVEPNEMLTIAGDPGKAGTYPVSGSLWTDAGGGNLSPNIGLPSPGALAYANGSPPLLYVADGPHILVINLGNADATIYPNASPPMQPITIKAGEVQTIAGSSGATSQQPNDGVEARVASLGTILDLYLKENGSVFNVVFSEDKTQSIWRIDGNTGLLERIAGNGKFQEEGESETSQIGDKGPAKNASFAFPSGLQKWNDFLLVADQLNNRIRAINLSNQPQTIAGKVIQPQYIDTISKGLNLGGSELTEPVEVVVDNFDPTIPEIYVSDRGANRILKINANTRKQEIVVGTGTQGSGPDGGLANKTPIGENGGIHLFHDNEKKFLLLTDDGDENKGGLVRVVNLHTSNLNFGHITNLPPGTIATLVGGGTITKTTSSSIENNLDNEDPKNVKLDDVIDVAMSEGTLPAVYILERIDQNNVYRVLAYNPNASDNLVFARGNSKQITIQPGKISAIAIFNSSTPSENFLDPLALNPFQYLGIMALRGVASSQAGQTNLILMLPSEDHYVIAINYSNTSQTIVGTSIPPGEGKRIAGLYDNSAGVYKQGYNGDFIQAVNAKVDTPLGLTFLPKDKVGDADILFIADGGNNRIRAVFGDTSGDLAGLDGTIFTIVGTGEEGYNGETLPAQNVILAGPTHLAAVLRKNFLNQDRLILYFVDENSGRLRQLAIPVSFNKP